MSAIRCAAHTLQLAVNDSLRTDEIQQVITNARSVIKKLQRPNMAILLKKQNIKRPIIDCTTRWNLTLLMLRYLSDPNVKEFCNNMAAANADFFFSREEWKQIEEIVTALQPSYEATLKFQSEQLIFGDFYAAWLQCKLQTHKLNNSFAQSFYITICQNEKTNFFHTKHF